MQPATSVDLASSGARKNISRGSSDNRAFAMERSNEGKISCAQIAVVVNLIIIVKLASVPGLMPTSLYISRLRFEFS